MGVYELRLFEDLIESGGAIEPALPPCKRVLYVVEGSMGVVGEAREWQANSAWFGTGPCSVKAGAEGVRMWRWELAESPLAHEGLASGSGVSSRVKKQDQIELDSQDEYLMRCDRVDFPLGGIAYTHIHAGPGTRCLLEGTLDVQLDDGEEIFVEPGGVWFERGPDPIYAQASEEVLTSFIRAMVLPRSYRGKSSITYVKAEEADKPKRQEYTRFVDEFIDL